MKRILLFAVLLLGAQSLFAADSYFMAIGPFIFVKGGVNAGSIPDGRKTAATFVGMPDLGLATYIPLTTAAPIGLTFDLGYRTEAILDKPNEDATDLNTIVVSYHYFQIAPMFNASAFTAGFVFGIPTGVKAENVAGDQSVTGSTSDMAVLVAFQLGVNATVFASETGQLNILGLVSYSITGLDANPTTGGSSTYNPHSATIGVGMEYLFRLHH